MGTKHTYTCPACDYSATVSGGRDIGILAVIKTMICTTCSELVDVRIGSFAHDGPAGSPELDKDLGRCPECAGKDVRPWSRKKPCPQCGERMLRDATGLKVMWD